MTLVAAAGCSEDRGGGGGDGSDGEFPRNETLYTTGTEWADYSNYNPIAGGGQATGVLGLLYESLFVFNTQTAELEPWLAESGEWVDDTTYEIRLRDGVTWTDGEAFNADDVVFTLDLRNIPEVPYSTMAEWVDTVEAVDDLTVRVTFSDPRRAEWENWLFEQQIAAEHLWAPKAQGAIMDERGDDVRVGTGPYVYHSNTTERIVWERNDDWWGTEALGLEMKPRYIVDFKNQSNEVVIGQLQQAEIDLSNNFLPGEVIGGDIQAYNSEPPYMIPANTAYLIPNTTRPPLDDADFRRAMAFAINVTDIVDTAYAGLVSAADPTGLLPLWVDLGLVDQQVVSEHGFTYDQGEAESILESAGYVDTDDDGFRETPDGEPIELTLQVPAGWTDWNIAAEIIAENLQAVGINVTTDFPEAAVVDEIRTSGDFDLILNNWTELSNTPWTTYNYLFRLPVQDQQPSQNFQRYENEEAWELTQQLGHLSVGDPETDAELRDLLSQLQEISFTEMPAIPLWYNGLWAQWNTTYWTNWPTAPDGPPPTMWNNYKEKRAILMLSQIEPVEG
ncbi:MAG TPA: ABC transporter substrate-binding protein [Natronosporangium sp.]